MKRKHDKGYIGKQYSEYHSVAMLIQRNDSNMAITIKYNNMATQLIKSHVKKINKKLFEILVFIKNYNRNGIIYNFLNQLLIADNGYS